jgi:hypothetical protein
LLDPFRAGKISLEVVTAFTLGADHEAQLAVWRQLKDNSYIQSYTVKRLLTEPKQTSTARSEPFSKLSAA